MKYKNTLLLIIVIVAFILRVWGLGSVPLSPDWDEVALGYDAYSIMHTGRDEFGVFLPAVLRSFDDYKPALYAYLAIPSIALFGLTTFAVRFPSVVLGVIGILTMYFLVNELFENYKNQQILSLVCSFIFAISPWSLQFSRTAFETNVGVTFNLLIGLFFLKSLKKPWWLLLAALFAGLNLAVYQSERVFTPLLVLALVIIYRKELFATSKKYLIGSILIGLVAALPTIAFLLSNPSSLGRVQGTSITSQSTQQVTNAIIRVKDDKDNHDIIGQLIDNRRVVYFKEIVGGYLIHFDPNWLFVEGDNPRHHAPEMGLLYFLDLPFLLIGTFLFFFRPFNKKSKYFIFSWLLLAPIPAAITYEVPHAVRTMNMFPMLLIFTALGYVGLFQFLKKYQVVSNKYKVFTYVCYSLFIILAIFNFTYYINQYFVQQNYFNAIDWQYGYAQAIPQIEQLRGDYQEIIVSDSTSMDKSYMFFLFYLHYPPQQYQKLVAQGQNLITDDHHFINYEFRPFDWNSEKIKQHILYVGTVNNFPKNIKAKRTIYYPDSSPAILLVDPKDNI